MLNAAWEAVCLGAHGHARTHVYLVYMCGDVYIKYTERM